MIELQQAASKHGLWRISASTLVIASLLLAPLPLQAQDAGPAVVTPLPSENGQGSPRLDMAANGTPIVKIATPNASGTSYNRYTDFNVDARGLILNNSSKIVLTQLGGYIDGNGNLRTTGPAGLIINEVVGTNPSTLAGYIEIAGTPAQLVLANANGITCKGCGFLNTPWATLAAANPRLNSAGGLAGFGGGTGTLLIDGAGLDASGARLDLYARAIKLNAGIWASNVNASFGAGETSIAGGLSDGTIVVTGQSAAAPPAPMFGLDVAALGGMYANSIRLIGTEAGLGVNVAGNLASLEQGLSLSADGAIIVGGTVTAKAGATINAGSTVEVGGQLYAGGPVVITSSTLTGNGLIASGGDLSLTSSSINSGATIVAGLARDGSVSQSGNLSVLSNGALTLSGQALAHDNVTLSGRSIDLASRVQGASLAANASRIGITGDVRSTGTMSLAAASIANSGIVQGQDVTIHADRLDNNSGVIDARTRLGAKGSAVSNISGLIQSGGSLILSGTTLGNDGGSILALGSDALNLTFTGAITGTDGKIGGNGDVAVSASSLSLDGANASLIAAKALDMTTRGDMALSAGATMAAGGAVKLNAGGALNVGGAIVQSNSSLTANALTVSVGAGSALSGTSVAVNAAQSLTNNGTILGGDAGGTTSLVAGGSLANSGIIQANGADLSIRAASIGNSGDIVHAGAGVLSATVTGLLTNSGKIATNGTSTISAATIANTGDVTAANALSLTASNSLSNGGLLASGDALIVQAGVIAGQGGTFEAKGPLGLTAGDIALGNAQIYALGSAPLTLVSTGALTASGARIGGNGNVSLSAVSMSLGGSEMSALGTLGLTASTGDLNLGSGGVLASSGAVTVSSSGIIDAKGASVATNGIASLSATQILLDDGSLQADTFVLSAPLISLKRAKLRQTGTADLTLQTTGSLDYSGGEIYVGGNNFRISAGSIVNAGGAILHGGTGLLSIGATGGLDNSAGQIATNGTLALDTASLTNTGGQITASKLATLGISGRLVNDGGLIASGSGLTLTAGALTNAGGDIETTGALSLRAASLDGADGRILATGTGAALSLDVAGSISGTGVLISSTGNTNITAGSLAFGAGSRLTSAQALSVAARSGDLALGGGNADGTSVVLSAAGGTISTGAGGFVVTPGTLTLSGKAIDLSGGAAQGAQVNVAAETLRNIDGTLASLGDAAFNVSGAFDNSNGDIFAANRLTLNAGSLVNAGGRIAHAGTDVLDIRISGHADNAHGNIIGNGALSLSAGSLANDAGLIVTPKGGVLTVTGALSNLGGTVRSDKALTIMSGSLVNDRGSIDSLDALFVRSGSIANGSGSIIARGGAGLSVNGLTGQVLTLTNNTGTLASTGALEVTADAIDNTGSILGQSGSLTFNALTNSGDIYGSSLTLGGASLINTGGEIGSSGAIDIAASMLDNRSGLITSGAGGLTVAGAVLLNASGTLGGDGDVTLNTGNIDNGTGTIAAGRDLVITAATLANAAGGGLWAERGARLSVSDTLTNRGSIGAGTLLQANAATLDNGSGTDVGTLAAGVHLSLGFTNANLGRLVTGSDLTLAPTGDYIHAASANLAALGLLTLNIGGSLTNQGHLEGGTGVAINAGNNLANAATGEIIGTLVATRAAGDVLNEGLINGSNVGLSATNITNTARIYGDNVRVSGTSSIRNLGSDAVIATRSGLLALESAGAIENRNAAFLYSLGDLSIGGMGGSGSAASLINSSATIQAQGNGLISAGSITNMRELFTWDDVVTMTSVPDHIVYPTRPGYRKTELKYDETRTETAITADSGEGRIIIGGNLDITTQALANLYSTISAGGSLNINGTSADLAGGTITNTALVGRLTIDRTGRYRSTKSGILGDVHKSDPYSFYSAEDTFTVPAVISAGGTVSIDARTISNVVLSAQGGSAVDFAKRAEGVTRGNISPAYITSAVGGVSSTTAPAPVSGGLVAGVDVFAATPVGGEVSGSSLTPVQAGAFGFTLAPLPGQQVGAGGVPVLSLGGLFNYASPGSNYLVETDPRFTGYGNFLSSDYFLTRLGFDPTRAMRRLGDALYEQQLITNQLVAQAGVSRLSAYGNNELQYRALMDTGVTYMKAFGLSLGVGLSAEQMATLTSDIVLLVEVTVQTPGGPQLVLAPRVYLAQVNRRDLTSGGAIIAGNDVNLRARDTLENAGVVRAASSSTLSGNDILNTGRLDLGARGLVYASNDLINRGGIITGGNVTLGAGRDLNIDAQVVTTRTATAWQLGKSHGTQTTTNVTNFGSMVDVTGNLNIFAGRDLNVTGSAVNAGGALGAQAARINISGAIDSASLTSDSVRKSSGFLSSTKTTTRESVTDQSVVASTLSGDTVSLRSSGDANILGSNVVATNGVAIQAGGNVTIGTVAATDTSDQSQKVKKSGLSVSFGNGGLSVFAGVAKNATSSSTTAVTNTGSLVGASNGDVTITAGDKLTVKGSTVAASGDTTLAGKSVEITNATDIVDTKTTSKSSSFGVTISAQSPALSSAANAVDAAKIAGSAPNDRAKAVAALAGGLGAVNAVDAAKDVVGTIKNGAGDLGVTVSASLGISKTSSASNSHDETVLGSNVSGNNVTILATGAGKEGTIKITGSDVTASNNLALAANGPITIEAATETDTIDGKSKSSGASLGISAGVGLGKDAATGKSSAGFQAPTITLGVQGSKSSYSGSDVTNRESVLSAGGTASVTTPDKLTIDGSTLSGNRVVVEAGALDITSRQDTSTYTAKDKSFGASISYQIGGSVSAQGNMAKGSQQGDYASVAEQAGIQAGAGGYDINVKGNTDLKGAVIASDADASKNVLTTGTLTASDIENKESYKAKSMSLGIGLGEIGVDGKNRPTSDGSGTGIPGIGTPLGNLTATPPIALSASGSQQGTTNSAIAAGTIAITSGDTASQQTADAISRDTASANDGAIGQEFDTAKRDEIADSFAAARILAAETTTFFARRAAEQKEAEDKAIAAGVEKNPDGTPKRDSNGNLIALNATAQAYIDQASGLQKTYGSGSAVRIIATAINGAAGSNVTGSLGSLVQASAVNVLQSLAATEIKRIADSLMIDRDGDRREDDATLTSESVRAALQAVVGCAGAAAGGNDCGSAAMGASASVVVNYLLTSFGTPAANGDDPLSLEEQQARTQIIATLISGIASATGLDVGSATNAAQIESENNDQVETVGGTICVSGETQCEGRTVYVQDFSKEPEDSAFREIYDETLNMLGLEGKAYADLTVAEQKLLNDTISSHIFSGIEFHYFTDPKRAAAINKSREYVTALKDTDRARYDALVAEYGSEGAYILIHSLTAGDYGPANLIDGILYVVDPTPSMASGFGAIYGTGKGVVVGVVETASGIKDLVLNPQQAYDRAKAIIAYAKDNPEAFFKNLSEEGKKAYYALKSDLAKYDYAMQVGDRSSIFEASTQVGQKIGPFVAGFGVGGFIIKGSKIGNAIEAIVKTGKTPDLPDVDAPDAPNTPDGPDGGRTGGQDVDEDQPPPSPSQPPSPRSLVPDCLVNPVSCRGPDGQWTHWTNPETGKVEPIATAKNYDSKFRIEDDHILSQDSIKRIPGFGELTPAQQNELLNWTDNLQPLPKPMNCSKGCKSGLDWEWLKSQGVKINEDYKKALDRKQRDVRDQLTAKIQKFKTANGGT